MPEPMKYLPHALRWQSVGADGAPEWSPWHAMASSTVTLCDVAVTDYGDPFERAMGFGAVTCEACLAMTTIPVQSKEAPGTD